MATKRPRDTIAFTGTIEGAPFDLIRAVAEDGDLPYLGTTTRWLKESEKLEPHYSSSGNEDGAEKTKEKQRACEMREQAIAFVGATGNGHTVRIYVNGEPLDVDKHTTPSGFGDLRAGETRVDPDVRLASEVSAGVTLEWAEPTTLDGIAAEVHARLFPTTHVRLRFYKINVYGPGGKFQRHKDTPREGVLGTVVVIADQSVSAFEGGDLWLHSPGYSDPVCAGQDDEGFLTFAAFYSDVVHEVEEVASGTRISLTFDVVKDDTAPTSRPRPYVGSVDDNTLTNTTWSVSSAFLANIRRRKRVGVFCANEYSYAEIDAGLRKGADVELERVLRDAGCVEVTLTPVIIRAQAEVDPEDGKILNDKGRVYRLAQDDLQRALFHKPALKSVPKVDVFSECVDIYQSKRLFHSSSGGSLYTGNECRMGFAKATYFACVLVGAPAPAAPF